MRGYPDFIVTSIYVQSLLDAIWRLVEAGASGTLHVASSDALSKFDYGMLVAEQFGLDSGLIARLGPDPGAHAASRSRDLSLDTSRASGILGTPLPTQEQGVEQAFADEPLITPIIRQP